MAGNDKKSSKANSAQSDLVKNLPETKLDLANPIIKEFLDEYVVDMIKLRASTLEAEKAVKKLTSMVSKSEVPKSLVPNVTISLPKGYENDEVLARANKQYAETLRDSILVKRKEFLQDVGAEFRSRVDALGDDKHFQEELAKKLEERPQLSAQLNALGFKNARALVKNKWDAFLLQDEAESIEKKLKLEKEKSIVDLAKKQVDGESSRETIREIVREEISQKDATAQAPAEAATPAKKKEQTPKKTPAKNDQGQAPTQHKAGAKGQKRANSQKKSASSPQRAKK